MQNADILLTGTGSFGSRIAHDLAITASEPLSVVIGGRNPEKLENLAYAANARAAAMGCPARFAPLVIPWDSPETIAETIAPIRPRVVVHAATVQVPLASLTTDTPWSLFLRETGLTVAAPLQALLAARMGRALQMTGHDGAFINCSFPDVVNSIVAAKGLPITCGVGNVQIFAAAFRSALTQLPVSPPGRMQVLAHHNQTPPWNAPASERGGIAPRVWLDGIEIADVYEKFSSVLLTRIKPLNDVAGLTAVPLIHTLVRGGDSYDHAPGPFGLPGGYPVRIRGGKLSLDLPDGLTEAEAVRWNGAFEKESGTCVAEDGMLTYTGAVREALARQSPKLAKGFHVNDLETAATEMMALRSRMES